MKSKDNFKIINFRLNLNKEGERDLYRYLESIDKGGPGSCYGSKSAFIKEILIAHMHGNAGGRPDTGAAPQLSREEMKELVKEAFLECAGSLDPAERKTAPDVGTASSKEGESAASSVPEQSDKLPDDAMDYFKELL